MTYGSQDLRLWARVLALLVRRHSGLPVRRLPQGQRADVIRKVAHVQRRREFSNNKPYWDGVSVTEVLDGVDFMRFERSAGGHNFDFDTDVCTRCGIARRQYRDDGNPLCVAHNVVRLPTMNAPSPRLKVASRRLVTDSPAASA